MSGVVAGLLGSLQALIAPSFYAIRAKTPETGLSTFYRNSIIGYDSATSAVISLVGLNGSTSPYDADSWRLVSRNYNTGVINWVKKITPDGDFFGVSGFYFNLNVVPIGVVNSKIFVYMTNYLSQRIVAFNLDGTVFLSKEISSSFNIFNVLIDSSYNAYVATEESSWEYGKGSIGQTSSILGYNLLTGTKLSNTANPQHGVVNGNGSLISSQQINSSGSRYWIESIANGVMYNYVLRNSDAQPYEFVESTGYDNDFRSKQLTDDSFAYYKRAASFSKESGYTYSLYLFNYEISSLMKYGTRFDVPDQSRFSISSIPEIVFYKEYAYIVFRNSTIFYISKVNSKTGEIYWQKRLTVSLSSGTPSMNMPVIDPNGNLVFLGSIINISLTNANYSTIQYAVFNSDGSNMTGVKTFGAYTFTFANVDSVTFTSTSSSSWAAAGISKVALRTPSKTLTVGDYSKTPALTDKTSVYTEIKEVI